MKFKLKIKTVVMIGIIAISGLLIMAAISLAQDGTWIPKKDMSTPRWTPSASVVNGKIYVIGGFSTDRVLSTNEEYDPVTDTWKSKWSMMTARNALSTSVVNEKIYAIGGQSVFPAKPLKTVEEYNPATGRWTPNKKDMRYSRMALSTSAVNGKIYAIGGSQSHSGPFYSFVEEYDPMTDTWTTKTPMPGGPRNGLATSVVNGKIDVIGGEDGDYISRVEEYDPATDTWDTTKTPMPTARCYFTTCVFIGKIYAIGGLRDHVPIATVEVYDPATDTWETNILDMPTARWGLCANEVDGKIYATAGTIDTTGDSKWRPGLTTVEQFIPSATSVEDGYWVQNNPIKFLLHQNYPNPFNPTTTILYSLSEPKIVTLKVYDALGREIITLINGLSGIGIHSVQFDGSKFSSGSYFYKLQAGDLVETRKMLLMK